MLNRGGIFRLTAGDIPLDRGGLFKFGNFENRKGAAKPRPLCTPLGLFLSSARDSLFLFVDLCLYASVFSALRCADVFYFFTFSVIHFRQDACILRYSARHAVPMLFYFFTFSVVHFRQDVCILRYSAHYALRSLALNLSLPPLAVPSPTEVPQPPLPPSHPAQRRWPKTSRVASQSLTTKQPTRQPP